MAIIIACGILFSTLMLSLAIWPEERVWHNTVGFVWILWWIPTLFAACKLRTLTITASLYEVTLPFTVRKDKKIVLMLFWMVGTMSICIAAKAFTTQNTITLFSTSTWDCVLPSWTSFALAFAATFLFCKFILTQNIRLDEKRLSYNVFGIKRDVYYCNILSVGYTGSSRPQLRFKERGINPRTTEVWLTVFDMNDIALALKAVAQYAPRAELSLSVKQLIDGQVPLE